MKLAAPAVVVLAALAAAAPAAAEVRTETFRVGPVTVGPYQVATNYGNASALLNQVGNAPKPGQDGFVTGMEVDVVDAGGRPIPIQRLMLHHIVFQNLGRQIGEVRHASCRNFQLFDSQTTLPALFDPFYAAGEERMQLKMPPGHGYRMRADDRWLIAWMFMNHRAVTDRAYIQYRITYDTSPDLVAAKPVWLDVRNCRSDPVFTVPGGRPRGSTHRTSSTWRPPANGRLISGGGHVHGGAKDLVLSQPRCGGRTIATSEPTWGAASHPFYRVRPILHEPGPIAMTGFTTRQGIPVGAGQPVRLTARYDAELPHPRVMGILVSYFVPDAGVRDGCEPLPTDVQTYGDDRPGRRVAPRFSVPLTGLDRRGVARPISRPHGATRRLPRGGTIDVGNQFFAPANVWVRRGATLRWRFAPGDLHNVTVASGARGFHSENLNAGRTYARRFGVRGTYRLFCGLHPVAMTQTVTVG